MKFQKGSVEHALAAFISALLDTGRQPADIKKGLNTINNYFGADLEKAASRVVQSKFDGYKTRNGKTIGIQDANGEKVWLVPHDVMAELEYALLDREFARKETNAKSRRRK